LEQRRPSLSCTVSFEFRLATHHGRRTSRASSRRVIEKPFSLVELSGQNLLEAVEPLAESSATSFAGAQCITELAQRGWSPLDSGPIAGPARHLAKLLLVRTTRSAPAALDGAQRVVNLVLNLLILASLVLFAVEFVRFSGIARAWPIVQLHRFGDPIVGRVGRWLPLQARQYAPLLLAAIIYLVMMISDRLFAVARRAAASLKPAAANKTKAAATETKVESEKARAQLYKEYEKIEEALREAKRRRCAFLSVDVVGSTLIKSGETDIAVTATFRAYEDMLRRIFKATRAWKESWTPDGAMICFLNLSDAVKAGQSILRQLPAFNERRNRLKDKFDVRCGVNEGEVVIFEDSTVEKLVEHTIDVAGHMQKYATPGTLMLSKEVYDALEERSGFRPAGQEVDGYSTYEWSPSVDPEKANG
jgi:class 3 adenylate cyclase